MSLTRIEKLLHRLAHTIDPLWVEYDDLKYKRIVCTSKLERQQRMFAIKKQIAKAEKRFFESTGDLTT